MKFTLAVITLVPLSSLTSQGRDNVADQLYVRVIETDEKTLGPDQLYLATMTCCKIRPGVLEHASLRANGVNHVPFRYFTGLRVSTTKPGRCMNAPWPSARKLLDLITRR